MSFAKNFARNYEKKIILGTSDSWSMSHLSLQTSKPVYYIVDCRIFRMLASFPRLKDELTHFFFFSFYVDKQEVSSKLTRT